MHYFFLDSAICTIFNKCLAVLNNFIKLYLKIVKICDYISYALFTIGAKIITIKHENS